MSKRGMRRRCQEIVARLDVPRPFDAEELCRRVARTRGRPVRLAPLAVPLHGLCGVVASTDATDYVFYESATSPLHQAHIIAHEIGHLLCDHQVVSLAGKAAARLLLPDLDPVLVRRMLGRDHYSAVEEQEAELTGSLILYTAADRPATGEHTDALRGIGRTLAPRGPGG